MLHKLLPFVNEINQPHNALCWIRGYLNENDRPHKIHPTNKDRLRITDEIIQAMQPNVLRIFLGVNNQIMCQ